MIFRTDHFCPVFLCDQRVIIMSERIYDIEEILINAFPAVEREIYDGWIMNFSDAYTYRANCICPFYQSRHSLEKKIKHCEQQYMDMLLPIVYKMTDAYPEVLDKKLEEMDYKIEKYVDVLCCELKHWHAPVYHNETNRFQFVSYDHIDVKWIQAVNELVGVPTRAMALTQHKIFESISLPVICVSVICEEKIIGTGLGVIERGYVGLYAIHVHQDYRRKGLAERICAMIMNQGKMAGAECAHLQVRHGNAGAFALYDVLGFHKEYTQWFRVKKWPGAKAIFD